MPSVFNKPANALSKMADDGWKNMFFKLMGQTPESMGIDNFEQADKAVKMTQAMRNVQAPQMPPSYGPQDGYGTRNESIYPTR